MSLQTKPVINFKVGAIYKTRSGEQVQCIASDLFMDAPGPKFSFKTCVFVYRDEMLDWEYPRDEVYATYSDGKLELAKLSGFDVVSLVRDS